jgi:hypothetical protein
MNIEILKHCLSEKRILSYGDLGVCSNASETYKLNIQICGALSELMLLLEVLLRNAIDKKMREKISLNWTEYNILSNRHKEQIIEAKKRWEKRHPNNETITIDDIVSHLEFGFWTHLFTKNYATFLWYPALQYCFPSAPKRPNREFISNSLIRINNEVRNRISHCESMIKDTNQLRQDYDLIMTIIYWLSPQMCDWVLSFNDFENLYNELIKK